MKSEWLVALAETGSAATENLNLGILDWLSRLDQVRVISVSLQALKARPRWIFCGQLRHFRIALVTAAYKRRWRGAFLPRLARHLCGFARGLTPRSLLFLRLLRPLGYFLLYFFAFDFPKEVAKLPSYLVCIAIGGQRIILAHRCSPYMNT